MEKTELPKGLKEEDFGKRTLACNPLIAYRVISSRIKSYQEHCKMINLNGNLINCVVVVSQCVPMSEYVGICRNEMERDGMD